MEELVGKYMTFRSEDGILYGSYNDGACLDLAAAKMTVQQRKEASGFKPMPILISGKPKEMDKPARDYLGSEDSAELLTAAALLANSVFTRHLGNFFIKITYRKGKVPIRLFTDVEEAKKWLQQYKTS